MTYEKIAFELAYKIEWSHFDEHLNPVVNVDEPSEAKDNYQCYLEHQRCERHSFLPPCDLSS